MFLKCHAYPIFSDCGMESYTNIPYFYHYTKNSERIFFRSNIGKTPLPSL